MLTPGVNTKIYICSGYTDMRKGMNGLTILAQGLLPAAYESGAMFIFRGKNATKIKILYWDSNGFCLFYKCLNVGKFSWLKTDDRVTLGITRAQLAMLIEGGSWISFPTSKPPKYAG